MPYSAQKNDTDVLKSSDFTDKGEKTCLRLRSKERRFAETDSRKDTEHLITPVAYSI